MLGGVRFLLLYLPSSITSGSGIFELGGRIAADGEALLHAIEVVLPELLLWRILTEQSP
jgi:hypothetical protein